MIWLELRFEGLPVDNMLNVMLESYKTQIFEEVK